MSANVDIKIQLEAAKAEAQMTKFAAATLKAEAAVDQAQVKTDILNERLKQTAIATTKAKLSMDKVAGSLLKQRLETEKVATASQNAGIQGQILTERLKQMKDKSEQAKNKLTGLNLALATFAGNLASRAVSAGFQAISNGVRTAATDFLDYEVSLIAAAKTSGFGKKETEELGEAINELSRTTPLTTKELLRFAEIGGQLGLKGVAEVEAFSETFAKLSVATNIAGEESAIAFTKILGLTGELGEGKSVDSIKKLGSVITALGNDVKALETDIVAVSVEVSKGLSPFKLSSQEIAAYGATLAESGVAAEAAGSAMQKTFATIAEATELGGAELKRFSDLVGQTPAQFKKAFKDDPSGQFRELVKALSETGGSAGQLIQTLTGLGLNQQRTQRSLLPLITNYKNLEKNINTANAETSEAKALNTESAKAFNTTAANLQELNNQWNELTRIVIDAVLPAFVKLLAGVNTFFAFLREDGAAALEATGIALGVVATAALFTSGGFSALGVAAGIAWGIIAAPITLIIAGIAALAAAIFFVKKNWTELVNVGRSWVGLAPLLNKTADDTKKGLEKQAKAAKDAAAGVKGLTDVETKAVVDAQANQAMKDIIASQDKQNKKDQAQAARDLAAEQKRIRDESLAAENEFAELENQRFLFSTMQFTEFTQGRLSKLQEFFSLKEQIEAEAHILTLENDTERQTARLKLETEGQKRELAAKIQAKKKLKDVEKDANKIIKADNKQLFDFKIAQKQREVNLLSSLSGLITAIAGKETKASFLAAQAAAVGNIIINTQVAASRAMAEMGLVAGGVAAGFIEANGAIQVATVLAQTVGGLSGGKKFEQGGIVGGSSFTGDKVSARVNSGEMILNRQQQSQLFSMANGGGGNQGGGSMTSHVTVELDGEVVGRAVSRQVANGLQLGEVV